MACIKLQLEDNVKATYIQIDSTNQRLPLGIPEIRAQVDFYEWLKKKVKA
jgi:hypothetical protein